MAAFTFNQADGTDLEDISPLWAGDVPDLLEVQSSKLQQFGGNAFSSRAAYLNEAGSTYAIARFSAGLSNEYNIIIHSSDGTISNGYYCKLSTTSGIVYRNGGFETSFTIPGGVNVNSSNVEVRLERVGGTISIYAGPVGSTSLGATFSDGSPISGGFSGFSFLGGGTTDPGVISFDNGVAATTIYEFQSFSRGIGRGIARGIA